MKRQLSDGYLKQQVENAQKKDKISDCEGKDTIYNILDDDMHVSQEGIIALMYWETVNSYSLNKGYLQFIETSNIELDTGNILNITDLDKLNEAIEQANANGNKIYLSGVKPHDVSDGSMTSGFGDYLREEDISYYTEKGYNMRKEGKKWILLTILSFFL